MKHDEEYWKDLFMRVPVSMRLPEPQRPPSSYIDSLRYGVGVVRRPEDRIVTAIAPVMPTGPAVDAMLEDGWTWDGWGFTRDTETAYVWGAGVVVEVEDGPGEGEVFIRTGPPGHPNIGMHRTDDAGGDATRLEHSRWTRTWKRRESWLAVVEARREITRPAAHAFELEAGRVRSGRYEQRLPTNRKRKRERAKARRRARRAAQWQ